MKHAVKSALSLLFVLAVAAAPAVAKDRGHDRGKGHYSYSDRGYHHHSSHHRGKASKHARDDRYYRPAAPRVVYVPVHRPVYHPGHGPRWAKGVRYYDPGYGQTYAVRDYRGYGLRAPPRGHYWRRSDAGDYLLVAVATGIIADLILRH